MNNRKEQIKHAASEYTKGIIEGGTIRAMDFENGAKWADENPIENTNKRIRKTYRNGRRKYDIGI